ncbi:hypothetical protein CLF_101413 [Clonorchis sinensis]|uniref:Uncharacterized protein n=1 Tax=Clonorchis sinensis TaxID=79923 RepID=G7Y5P6_CLOSI|nr:hypothetical protein CLF_101413 [Clonorchis sinensis]
MKPIRQLSPSCTTTEMQRVIGMFAYYAHWISSFSDKVNKLIKNKTFPLPADVELAFDNLENENVSLITIEEADASNVAIPATRSQSH